MLLSRLLALCTAAAALRMPTPTATLASQYLGIASVDSTIKYAQVHGDTISVARSVRDLDGKARRTLIDTYVAGGDDASLRRVGPAAAVAESAASPSGAATVVAVQPKDGSDCGIELWRDGSAVARLAVKAEVHGAVRFHGQLSGFAWGAGEDSVVYVAARAPPKGTRKDLFAVADDDGAAPASARNADLDDWGESLKGTERLGLYVADFSAGTVALVAGTDSDDLVLFDPQTDPTGTGHVVCVGADASGRRMGRVACHNRPAGLYRVALAGGAPAQRLTPEGAGVRAPRFSPDGRRLALEISARPFDTHVGPVALSVGTWDGTTLGPLRELIGEASSAVRVAARVESLPGLWTCGFDAMPQQAWCADSRHLVVGTQWGFDRATLLVDAGGASDVGPAATVQRLVAPSALPAVHVLSAAPGAEPGAVVFASGPASPPRVCLLRPGRCAQSALPYAPYQLTASALGRAAEAAAAREALAGMQHTVLAVSEGVEVLLVRPAGETSGLILCPHGGPHSASTSSFVPSYAYLAHATNCAVAHVNYRGSIGYGTALLDTLPGRVGELDVEDCLAALDAALAELGPAHDGRVAFVGGSHGGFLGAHLAGRHSDRFDAVALRNPVTNLLSMVSVTDIPDWVFCEAGLPASEAQNARALTASEVEAFQKCSPLAHAAGVATPLLVAIGGSDKRVPPSQGYEFHAAVKAAGAAPTQLLVYPDSGHPIERVEDEADHWLAVASWFEEHLPRVR